MAQCREHPYIWATWLPRLLTGERSCEWAIWFKAHHQGWNRKPSDFNQADWLARHTALLNEQRDQWTRSGYEVRLENQNAFRLRGQSATLAGKPDMLVLNNDRILIVDVKGGQEQPWHHYQVMIYMYALPKAMPEYRDTKFSGEIVYGDHTHRVPQGGIDQGFIQNLGSLIRRIAAPEPPVRVPSAQECRFCDITAGRLPKPRGRRSRARRRCHRRLLRRRRRMASNQSRAFGRCIDCDHVKEDEIMATRPWRPISPLRPQPDDDLQREWLNYRSHVGDAGLPSLQRFEQQLHRSWAIETGIIEGLYRLDEAQTRTLIETGFVRSAIPPSGTGQDPDNLLAVLQDHMTVLDAIRTQASRGFSISRSAIRQLHQVMVAHQPTYRAMNQFGQWFDARLHAGTFKTMPNNPTRPDGVVHRYCPPEHVDSELDNLLSWYGEYTAQPDVYHPLLVAAWLPASCRFTPLRTATAA